MFKREFAKQKWPSLELHPELAEGLFPLEIKIVGELARCCVKGFAKFEKLREWTRDVKKRLHDLGQEQGFLVYPELVDKRFKHQWLFDLVWVEAKYDSKTKAFDWQATRGLKLACESEWGTGEVRILEDFLKLTFVVADIRLFVYENPERLRTQWHPVDLCKNACPLSKGFRYLLVGLPKRREGKLRVDCWSA